MVRTITDLLAENLTSLRKERGWSQEKLAESANIKFDIVQRAEGKTNFPRQDKITALAMALGVPESRLFTDRQSLIEPTPMEALKTLERLVMSRNSEKHVLPPDIQSWIGSHKVDERKWAMVKKFLGIPDQKKKQDIG